MCFCLYYVSHSIFLCGYKCHNKITRGRKRKWGFGLFWQAKKEPFWFSSVSGGSSWPHYLFTSLTIMWHVPQTACETRQLPINLPPVYSPNVHLIIRGCLCPVSKARDPDTPLIHEFLIAPSVQSPCIKTSLRALSRQTKIGSTRILSLQESEDGMMIGKTLASN